MLRLRRNVMLFDGDVDELKFISERVTVNPRICFGKPTIRGTRIWVGLILRLLASGWSWDEILKEYSFLTREDIEASLLYAAWVAERADPLELYSRLENKNELIGKLEDNVRELIGVLKDWLSKQGVRWLFSDAHFESYKIGDEQVIVVHIPIYEWSFMDLVLSKIYEILTGDRPEYSWFEIRLMISKKEISLNMEKFGIKYSLLTNNKLCRDKKYPPLILDPRPIIPGPREDYHGYIIIIPMASRFEGQQPNAEQ